jgi:hypothetical protein
LEILDRDRRCCVHVRLVIQISSVHVICWVVVDDDIDRHFGGNLVVSAGHPVVDEREEVVLIWDLLVIWLNGNIEGVDHRPVLLVSDFAAVVDIDLFEINLLGDIFEGERAR